MICKSCGNTIKEIVDHCPYCGEFINELNKIKNAIEAKQEIDQVIEETNMINELRNMKIEDFQSEILIIKRKRLFRNA